jgi:hypothetical protein
MQTWHAEIEEKFGPNAWLAHLVYNSLARHRIYYVDFRPTNMNRAGHPNCEPFPTFEPDDF